MKILNENDNLYSIVPDRINIIITIIIIGYLFRNKMRNTHCYYYFYNNHPFIQNAYQFIYIKYNSYRQLHIEYFPIILAIRAQFTKSYFLNFIFATVEGTSRPPPSECLQIVQEIIKKPLSVSHEIAS